MSNGKPGALWMHLTFWASIITFGAAIGMMIHAASDEAMGSAAIIFLVSFVAMMAFCVVLGMYMSKMGRSAVLWGALTFITLPIGMLVAYPAALLSKPA